MLLRNRELLLQAALSCGLALVCGAVAWGLAGRSAGMATLVCGGICALLGLGMSVWRYRRLASLSARIDACLSGARDVSFADMSEGELAVLTSQLSKTLSRLQLANDSLEEEKTSLADALADISHQLRTPLTSLGIELTLMRRDADTPVRLARVRNAERLLARVHWLVGSLLKLARIDAGVVRLERRSVEVGALVEDAFAPLAVSFDLADISFGREVEEGASFEGDRSWTLEALSNVLKNCLEHTPPGGLVRLRCWEDAVACRIRVEDSGPGIASQDLPHVFERFYRGTDEAELPSEANPAGVGIGLSLARALVEAQDGTITAGNATDRADGLGGARFDIAFYKVVV